MSDDFYIPDFYAIFPSGFIIPKPELDDQGRPTTLFGKPVVYTDEPTPTPPKLGTLNDYNRPAFRGKGTRG